MNSPALHPPDADHRRKVEVRLSRTEHEQLRRTAREHLRSAAAEARLAIVKHLQSEHAETRRVD